MCVWLEVGGGVVQRLELKSCIGTGEDRTAKSRLGVVRVTDSQFADDAALYARSRTTLGSACKFVSGASAWGLTVITEKTKGMAMGEELSNEDVAPVQVEGGEIKMVEQVSYLGSVLSCDGKDVKSRVAKASKAFGCLRIPIFNHPIPLNTNKESSVQGYSGVSTDVWTRDLDTYVRHLTAFHNRCVRTILGFSSGSRVTS